MADRPAYWIRQALKNLDYAADSANTGQHDSACFAAQQAAELAVKAVHERLGHPHGRPTDPHDVWDLLRELPPRIAVPHPIYDAARTVDHLHLAVRCHKPDAPEWEADLSDEDSENAIRCAESIIDFCKTASGVR